MAERCIPFFVTINLSLEIVEDVYGWLTVQQAHYDRGFINCIVKLKGMSCLAVPFFYF